MTRERAIEVFAALGSRLRGFGSDGASRGVIARAAEANGWFPPAEIVRAVESIREQMLDPDKLREWLAPYPRPHRTRDVAVVMAGNIPLVGFFDMLCVAAAGHNALVKPSSKDSVLIEYIVKLLKEIDPGIGIAPLDETARPEAVIATGSDNTNRYFRRLWGHLPSLLRGDRTSAAIIDGRETADELDALGDDIFLYNGLGCRNVGHLLVPRGYDIGSLAARLSQREPPGEKYLNNFRQRAALLDMQGAEYVRGAFFALRESSDIPLALSEITYQRYDSDDEIRRWISGNAGRLQCIVARDSMWPGSVVFGRAQHPTLRDWPDGVDVMDFLVKL